MKKTSNRLHSLFAALAALILAAALAVPAFAVEGGFADLYYRMFDDAEVLTEDEDNELEDALEELSLRQSFDVTIATIESMESVGADSMEQFADDLYDYCQYGYGPDMDGVLLLVSVGDRKWHISTCGYGITVFTDAGIRKDGDAVAAGGDVPLAVAHAHQQKHAVHIGAVAVLAVVIQIIGKLLHAVGTNAFHRLDGGNGHIEALAQAQLFQCVLQLVVLVLGQHLSVVEHAVVQVGKAALYRKGRNSQRRRKNQCCQRRKEGVQSVGSLFHRSSLLYRIRASHSSHITP